MTRKVTYQQFSKGNEMEDKITSLEDKRFWDEFIPVMNDYFEDRLNIENKYRINKYNCLRALYNDSGSNQPTQDFTKNIATTYESVIEKIAIEKYVEKFGYYEGVCKFAETFKLVYILKTYEQVENVIGINLSGSLVVNDIKHLNITYVG